MTDLILTDVTGVGSAKAKLLESHGIASVDDLIKCSLHELCQIPGIKEISANILKSSAKQLLDNKTLPTVQSTIDNKVTVSAKKTEEDIQDIQNKQEINPTLDKIKGSKNKIKDKKKNQKDKDKKKKDKDKKKKKKKKIKGKDKKSKKTSQRNDGKIV